LPIVFADKLPNRPGNGYERLGFVYDSAPHKRPIGTSYLPGKVPLVGLNCATCHTGTIRFSPSDRRQIVPGMPANQMDLQGYGRFLTACANDPRFNASTLIEAIANQNPDFGFFGRLIYRFFVISRARSGILDRAKENAWFDARPPFGPGRVDTFNPYKVLLRLGIENDKTVGTVDLPSLWNQRIRRGLWLHWDGNNDLVEERNKSAAIGAGATPDSLNLASMTRLEEWIMDLKPPERPRPFSVGVASSVWLGTNRSFRGRQAERTRSRASDRPTRWPGGNHSRRCLRRTRDSPECSRSGRAFRASPPTNHSGPRRPGGMSKRRFQGRHDESMAADHSRGC
jgi:hypothetical protein